MSKLIFVCPNTATTVTKLASSNVLRPLYENLWLVSRQSYERCALNQTTDSELILCDNPFNLKYYTVIFKKYSAGVDLKFEPGKEYYFIGKRNQLIDSIFSIPFLPSPLPSLTEHLTLNKGEGWSGGGYLTLQFKSRRFSLLASLMTVNCKLHYLGSHRYFCALNQS